MEKIPLPPLPPGRHCRAPRTKIEGQKNFELNHRLTKTKSFVLLCLMYHKSILQFYLAHIFKNGSMENQLSFLTVLIRLNKWFVYFLLREHFLDNSTSYWFAIQINSRGPLKLPLATHRVFRHMLPFSQWEQLSRRFREFPCLVHEGMHLDLMAYRYYYFFFFAGGIFSVLSVGRGRLPGCCP